MLLGLAAVGTALLAAPAAAQDSWYAEDPAPPPAEDYARQGPYLAAAGLVAIERIEDGGGALDDFGDSGGLELRGGYRFHEHFAGEATFEWAGEFDGELAGQQVDVGVWTLSGNLRAYLLPGQLQPYARVGVGVMRTNLDGFGDDHETDVTVRLGGGFEVYLTPEVALTLDSGYTTGGAEDLDFVDYVTVSLGAVLRF